MQTVDIAFDDVTLSCDVEGPENGPLALMIHGFPDTRRTYRYLAPELAALGYRAVSVSLRGYAPSSVAIDGNYQLAAVAHDVLRLHDAFEGDENAVLIGHDWGAAVTYLTLSASPQRWRRAVALSVPPMAVFASAFLSFDQLRASWYMFFFQNPLADIVVPFNNAEFVAKLCATWSPDYDWNQELPDVLAALDSPERVAAALGYYRSMFDSTMRNPAHQFIQDAATQIADVPVLYLHGANDGCILSTTTSDVLAHLGAGSQSRVVEGVGHFLHLEQPEIVNAMITDWLRY